jgi:HTH-type transcriptional regulator / antitoxin HigA
MKKLTLTPIRTQADYDAALRMAARYFENEPAPDSAEGAHFEALITLIEAYEAKHFPIAPPSPVDAIKFRMEQAGLTVNDLVPSIGQRNRVYEVLKGKRALTLPMIRNLHRNLGIPLDSLVGA